MPLFSELGASADIELCEMNPKDPNQEKLAQYRILQPHGTVPCLAIEGRQPIIESGAICMYLTDVYQQLGPELDRAAFYRYEHYSDMYAIS